jgi:site-specific recombinase XerD
VKEKTPPPQSGLVQPPVSRTQEASHEDQVRQVLRVPHYSYRTEQCYVAWVTHYLRFCKGDGPWRHPRELAAADVEQFLSHLAIDRRVSASTQNQALNALVFLYGAVLRVDLGDFYAVRALRRQRLPTVLSRAEIGQLLERLEVYSKQEPYALMARLMSWTAIPEPTSRP